MTQWLKEVGATEAPLNASGVEPLDMRVVVLPDPVEEMTKGGIILTQTHTEREQHAAVRGLLVAVGVNAWCEARAARDFDPPVPGERVMFAKYGGSSFEGADGQTYRMMNDEDVVGRLEE